MTERVRVAADPGKRTRVTAAQTELGGRYVAGSVLAAFLQDLLLEEVGWPWVTSGRLSVRFRRPVMDGEEVTLMCREQPSEEPGERRFEVAIVTNKDGERAVIGEARVAAETANQTPRGIGS